MNFVLKKINSKLHYPFIEDIKCFVVYISLFKPLPFDNIQIHNLTLGLSTNCMKNMYNVIVTDGDYIKFLINLDNLKVTKELAICINSKIDKIKTHYAK